MVNPNNFDRCEYSATAKPIWEILIEAGETYSSGIIRRELEPR